MTESRGYMLPASSTEHETPQDLFDALNSEFRFTVDVCATPENAKCKRFWTKEQDGLAQDWAHHVCWCNPPYGEPEQPCKPNCKKKRCQKRGYHVNEYIPGIVDWVRKADTFSRHFGAVVVMLLPSKTETRWFHAYIWDEERRRPRPGVEVRFLKGRLRFVGAAEAAPFPSMVVVFRPSRGKSECG